MRAAHGLLVLSVILTFVGLHSFLYMLQETLLTYRATRLAYTVIYAIGAVVSVLTTIVSAVTAALVLMSI
jgi:hypothetical protein